MKKETNNQENTMSVFHYLTYQCIKESDAGISFLDFIQKLEKLQKTHTIRSSVCNVRNKRVTSYSILLQKKAV
ncbi:hypothetical protein HMPREF1394_00111 [Helicobacter pylori GAM105Ai]|uniref:hypothetical protein n=1 Tax=Helicobacter pylori TaxID=210 RepID=UPI0002BA1AD1|nr:hypothetical protein [Helicobacter pylori]EMG84801.1 hypothetical protein HMPREF1394_00111 [Helicobacter pylori GAM105Ai]